MRTMFVAVPMCLFVLFLDAGSAQAQFAAKPGVYLSLRSSPGTTIDGDHFDGFTFFNSAESGEVTVLPRLGLGNEVDFVLGWRSGPGAVEIGYHRTAHGGTFRGSRFETQLSSVDVDFKGFLLSRFRVQPFVVGGFGLPWLTIEDASATRSEIGDAVFTGGSLKVGGGVAVYVHPRVAFTAGYDYRFVWLLRAKGVVSPYEELKPAVRGQMRNMTAGATFTF